MHGASTISRMNSRSAIPFAPSPLCVIDRVFYDPGQRKGKYSDQWRQREEEHETPARQSKILCKCADHVSPRQMALYLSLLRKVSGDPLTWSRRRYWLSICC
jgi:hypothetical protein